MKNLLAFLVCWAVLGSLALGFIAAWCWVVFTFGSWFLLTLPLALLGSGLCMAGISWADVKFLI